MIVAGIGCRSGSSVAEIMAAIHAALDKHEVALGQLRAIATVPVRRAETGLHDAALLLGLPLAVPDVEELSLTNTLTHSAASIAATGLPSASEAAALAACGAGSRLLGPRTIAGTVTCALAIIGDHQ